MSVFEDALARDERILRLQNEYSDDEILMELRRRGRLARVESENFVPDRHVQQGLSLDYQIRELWELFAQEATRKHLNGQVPSGFKVENVKGDGMVLPSSEKARQMKFVVNYVIDLPKVEGQS